MLEGYTLELLESKIHYNFKNKELIKEAMTHSSYANERKINQPKDYERLEFLGDAVLELISSEFLFLAKPELPEGKMTKLRSSFVCEQALAYCAKDLELGSHMSFGKGELSTGGRNRDSIIADAMESLIGAIYIDGGFASAKEFVVEFILSDLEDKQLFYDSKTKLQEKVQSKGKTSLVYEVVGEIGPDHSKQFVVNVKLQDQILGNGQGKTKKAAEQQAAHQALLTMKDKSK